MELSIESSQTNISLPSGVYALRIGNYFDKIVIK
jgi:hypothetical protein